MATYYWRGGSGTWNSTNTTNWATTSGGAGPAGPPTSADTVTFDANSGTGTCTTDATAAAAVVNFTGGANIGLTLGAGLTISGAFTHTSGTVSLGSYTLSVNNWSSSNSNTRTIAFGTGQINLTGTGTVWTTSTVTNFSYTGTSKINLTNSGSTATTVTMGTMSEAQSMNVNVTAGTYALAMTGAYKSIDFTGYSFAGGGAASSYTLYGNLTLSSTQVMPIATSTITLSATSGTQTITTNGTSVGANLVMNGVGGTVALGSALTLSGLQQNITISGSAFIQGYSLTCSNSTISYTGSGAWTTSANISGVGTPNTITVNGSSSNWTINSGTIAKAVTLTLGTITAGGTGTISVAFTHTAGTIAIGNNALSILTISSSNSNTRSITFGSGTLTITGSGATAWNYATSTGLSITTGTGTISMTSGAAKTFAGGSYTNYPTLNNGGAGALTISGSNTFAGISNSVQPTTFTLTSGTTQSVANWNVNGTAGNLVVLNATTAGTQASMVYTGVGTPTSSYLNIKDSAVS